MSVQASENAASSLMLNPNVTVEQVVGLVESVAEHSPEPVDTGRLSEESRAGADLLPVLDIAKMLDLVSTEQNKISITELGLKLSGVSNYRSKAVLLKESLSKVEPCSTTLTFSSNYGSASAKQISKVLQTRGIRWDQDNEINESMITSILINWGVEAELLKRNKRGKFTSFSQEGSGTKSGIIIKAQSRAEARKQFRMATSEARKKYILARKEAWKTYRSELIAAKKAHDKALAEARRKEKSS